MKYVIGGLTRFAENPSLFKTMDFNKDDKSMIIDYMKNSKEPCGVGGYIDDLKEGKSTQIENAFYEDDIYMWSSQDIYHIENYNAAIDPDFIIHVKDKRKNLAS